MNRLLISPTLSSKAEHGPKEIMISDDDLIFARYVRETVKIGRKKSRRFNLRDSYNNRCEFLRSKASRDFRIVVNYRTPPEG